MATAHYAVTAHYPVIFKDAALSPAAMRPAYTALLHLGAAVRALREVGIAPPADVVDALERADDVMEWWHTNHAGVILDKSGPSRRAARDMQWRVGVALRCACDMLTAAGHAPPTLDFEPVIELGASEDACVIESDEKEEPADGCADGWW